MDGEKIVTEFDGLIVAIDCGEHIYLDPGADKNLLESILESERNKRTA